MKQYLEILGEILEKGTWKEPARENMPRTIDRFSIEKRFDLQEGFPLLTTKKMYWKGILHEIIWMLKGDTNIKYLVDNGVSIWTDNAYKFYLKIKDLNNDTREPLSKEDFIQSTIRQLDCSFDNYKFGDLGKIYGYQWTNWTRVQNGFELTDGLNQIQKVINSLKENPYSRYHLVTSWNPSEMFESAQPNCHIMFQFNCRVISLGSRLQILKEITNQESIPGSYQEIMLINYKIPQYYLDCKMVQRSCDTFLGVPFNIAQYAFLTHIIAKFVNMVPGELIWSGNSVHIYENHVEQVKEQLKRIPMKLCDLKIKKDWKSINDIQFEDFEILNYQSHPAIKGELSVGL